MRAEDGDGSSRACTERRGIKNGRGYARGPSRMIRDLGIYRGERREISDR